MERNFGKIMACVDGSSYAASVCDYAAWSAGRLDAPVEVVHAIGRRETESHPFDLSGSLEFEERAALMEELADLDEKRAKIAMKRGRAIIQQARERIGSASPTLVTEKLRHGDIADAIAELEDEVRFVIIGKRGEAADFSKGHLGSNLERVIRSTKRPILVVSRAFQKVERFLIAFDGGRSSPQVVEKLVESPLLKGIPCELFMVGRPSGEAGQRLADARNRLVEAGYSVKVSTGEGEADEAIARQVESGGIGLIVMGAYGHSRIRNFLVGSTTTQIIRSCRIPAMIVR